MQTTAAGNHPAPNSTPDTRTDELVRKHIAPATENRPLAIYRPGQSLSRNRTKDQKFSRRSGNSLPDTSVETNGVNDA
jgi:hypothetical protein